MGDAGQDYSEKAQEFMADMVAGKTIVAKSHELDALSDREVYLLSKAAKKLGYVVTYNSVTGTQTLTPPTSSPEQT